MWRRATREPVPSETPNVPPLIAGVIMFCWLSVSALMLAAVIYFLPSIVARHRRHRNLEAIKFVNFFLGWTLIGWVGVFAWALLNQETRQEKR